MRGRVRPVGLEARHQIQNVAAQYQVLAVQDVAAKYWKLARLDARRVLLYDLLVLREGSPGVADGRDAQPEERRDVAGGVAHEVTVELAFSRRRVERVCAQS